MTKLILNLRRSLYGPPKAFAIVFCMLLPVCVSAQLNPYEGMTFSPAQPGDGSTLAGRIARGDLICLPFSGDLFWPADQRFTSFAGLKVTSDNGAYNLVIPKDGRTDELCSAYDTDYVLLNNFYTAANLDSAYRYSFTGDPYFPHSYETTRNSFAPYRVLSRNYYKTPVGKYDIRCTYNDLGVVPEGSLGSVADDSGYFDYKLFIVDFIEQDRILPCDNTVVPIDLRYTPSDVPNKSSLLITVKWEGTDSSLYEDSTCQSMITGADNTKTWSAVSAPSYIYFKRVSGDISARQYEITLKASVNMTTRPLAVKKLQAEGGFAVTQVKGGTTNGSDLCGWWTGSFAAYPATEWEDGSTPPDGEAEDEPGSANSVDVNRPLLYKTTDKFVIHSVSISHGNGIVYSENDYYLRAVSDDGRLDANAEHFTDTNGIIAGTNIEGSVFSAIDCKDVYIRWKLIPKNGGDTIEIGETKHKVYVMRGTAANPYHTLVDLSCGAAKGLSLDPDILQAMWEKVQTLRLTREDGGAAFKYWGPEASIDVLYPFYQWYFYCDGVIGHRDGRCGGWAHFFEQLCAIQGIDNISEFDFYALGRGQWFVTGPTHKERYVLTQKSPFQGGNLPNGVYSDHVINVYNNVFYDVTTGSGPYSSFQEYLLSCITITKISVDGIGDDVTISTTEIPLTPDNISYYIILNQ